MTQIEPGPIPTTPARIRVSNPRKFWIALSLLIISLIVTVIAAKYFKADPEAVHADQAAAQITAVKKTVLVMLPYQIDLPVNVISTQAIREEFGAAADLKLDVYYEYLDLNRFSDPDYQQKIFDLYADKYKNKQIDLVITVTERMLSLWLAQRAEILPNVPIVFFDITTEHLDALKLPSDVTGVSGVLDYTNSAQWVLDKLPAVNEIVIVHGVGQADQEYLQPLQNLQEKMKGQIKLTDLSNLPLAEIKQRVADLPKSSVVFYALMFEDAAGVKYIPINAMKELTAVSAVPVISGYDALIGTGSIGGYVYSYDHQARDAARIGLRILRGEAVGTIPIIKNQSNQFIFDHVALQRYGIPLSALPAGSIIINRQYTVWELYQPQIMAITVVFVIMLLLVVAFLVIVTQRLNSARLGLSRLNIDLEDRVQERTLALSESNHELELEITNRRLVEDDLRVSEEEFRLAFAISPDSKNISRLEDGKIVTINAGFTQMLGFTLEECIGKTTIDLNVWDRPEDRQMLVEGLSKHGEISNLEVCFRAKDGDIKYGIMSAAVIDLNGGKHIISNTHDITERKQMEETLRENEDRFRSMFEMHGAVMLLIEPTTGLILNANYAAEKFYGYPREQLCSMNISDINTLQPEEILAERKRALANERNYFNFQHRLANGDVRRVEVYSSPLLQNGKPVLFSLIHDVTERRQAEEALSVSEASYRRLFETAQDGILILNAYTGRIVDVNPYMIYLLGFSREQLLGKYIWDIGFPQDMLGNLEMFLKLQQKQYVRYEDLPLKAAQGRKVYVEFIGSVYFVDNRKVIQCNVRDISERMESKKKILQLNNDLEKLASTDGLTGINNHRSLLKLAERELDVARRYQSMFSMMFFDIDNFKQINDTFGHAMGDLALIKTVQTVCAELRSADLIGRYGGDEFVILLPQTSAQDALPLAERILASIPALRVDTMNLTISIGIAETLFSASQPDTVEKLLHRADMALYAAKQDGKNCIRIYS